MSLVTLNYAEAHALVDSKQRELKSNDWAVDVRWDNYDLVFFKPTPFGFQEPRGEYRRNRWGMKTVIPVSSDGTWKIPVKLVRGK